MTDRGKMYLRLSLFLLVAIGIGVLLFTLFFARTPDITPPEQTGEETGAGGLPSAGTGSPTTVTPGSGGESGLTPSAIANGGLTSTLTLTTSRILSPQPSGNGVIYYDPADGRFYRILPNGDVEAVIAGNFPSADSVIIAPDTSKAVVEFPDGANLIVDLISGTNYSLPNHWTDFSFTPDSSEIISKSLPTDINNRALVSTSADGSTTTVIAELGDKADRVEVSPSPSNDVLAFSATGGGGSAFGQSTVYLVSPEGEASGAILVNGSNFKSLWSPNGSNFLYSVADAGDDYRPSLWYTDKRGDRQGAVRVRLPVKTTADKCVFKDATVAYCAVPKEAPAGSGGNSALLTSGDTLVSISLPSGQTSQVATTVLDLRMRNLSLSEDGATLYFTDQSGRLTSLRLR